MDRGGNPLPRNTLRRDRPASSLGIQYEGDDNAGSKPNKSSSVAHLASLFDTMIMRQRYAAPMPEKHSMPKESVIDRRTKKMAAPSSPKYPTEIPDDRKEKRDSKVSALIANFNKVYSSQVTIGRNASFSPGFVRSTNKAGKDVRNSCPSFRTSVGPVDLDCWWKASEYEASIGTTSKSSNLSPTCETTATAPKTITGKGTLDRFRKMDSKSTAPITELYHAIPEGGAAVKTSCQPKDSKKNSKGEFFASNNSVERISSSNEKNKSAFFAYSPSLVQNPTKGGNSCDEKPLSGRNSVNVTQTLECSDKSAYQSNASIAKEISIGVPIKKNTDEEVKIIIIEQKTGIGNDDSKDVKSKAAPSIVKEVVNRFESNLRLSCKRQNVLEKTIQISPRSPTKEDFVNQHFKASNSIETNLCGIRSDLRTEKCKLERDLSYKKPIKGERSSLERVPATSIYKGEGEHNVLFSDDISSIGNDIHTLKGSVNKVKDLIMKLEEKSKITHKCSTAVQNKNSMPSKPTNTSKGMSKAYCSKNNDSKDKLLAESFAENKNRSCEELKDFSTSLIDETYVLLSKTKGTVPNEAHSVHTTPNLAKNEKIGGDVSPSAQNSIINEHALSQRDDMSNVAEPNSSENTFLISENETNKVLKETDTNSVHATLNLEKIEKIGSNLTPSVQELTINDHALLQRDEMSNAAEPNSYENNSLISEIKPNKVSQEMDEKRICRVCAPRLNLRQALERSRVTKNRSSKPLEDPLGRPASKSAQNERQDFSVLTDVNKDPKSEKILISEKIGDNLSPSVQDLIISEHALLQRDEISNAAEPNSHENTFLISENKTNKVLKEMDANSVHATLNLEKIEKNGSNLTPSVQDLTINDHALLQRDEMSNAAEPNSYENTFLISENKSNKVSKEMDGKRIRRVCVPRENLRQALDTWTKNRSSKPLEDTSGRPAPKSSQNERQDCSVPTDLNNLRINDNDHFYEEISPKSEKSSLSNKDKNYESVSKPSEDMPKCGSKVTNKDSEFQNIEIIDNLRETSDKIADTNVYEYTKLNSLYSECSTPQCIQSDKCCCRPYTPLNNSYLSEENIYEEISAVVDNNPPLIKTGNHENILKSSENMPTCNPREMNQESQSMNQSNYKDYEPTEYLKELLDKSDTTSSGNTESGPVVDNNRILQSKAKPIHPNLSSDSLPNKSEQNNENIYVEILPGAEEIAHGVKAEQVDDIYGEFENKEENGGFATLETLADQVASEKASLLIKKAEIDFERQSKSLSLMHHPREVHGEMEAKNDTLCKIFGSRLSQIYEDSECNDDASPCTTEGNNVSRQMSVEKIYQKYSHPVAEEPLQREEIEENVYEDIENVPLQITRVQSRSKLTEIVQQKGGVRTLWSQLPEVTESRLFESLSANERKIQETKFEIIASESSYVKALNVLISHFMASESLMDEIVINRGDKHVLFGDIQSVKRCSERFLEDLERCWSSDIFLQNIDEIICNHAKNHFGSYVGYCSKQVYQANMMKRLLKSDPFYKAITKLQSDKICQNQSLYSFLILPMQRVTRIRLLIQTIISLLPKSDEKLDSWKEALFYMNDVVERCNEGARKAARVQETVSLSKKLDFKDMAMFPLLTGNRWIELKGELLHYSLHSNSSGTLGISSTSIFTPSTHKLSIGRKLSKETLSVFLFTDLLLITKKHSEDRFLVIDYCQRNLVRILDEEEEDLQLLFQKNNPESWKNIFVISLLKNCEKRNVKMVLSSTSEEEKKKWLQAFPREKPAVTEDCCDGPYLSAISTYAARSENELSLEISDVLKVTKKAEGWCHGIRVKDGERGWFPGKNCIEVESKHAYGACTEKLNHQQCAPHYNPEEKDKKYKSTDAKTEKKKLKFKTGSSGQSYKTAIKKSVKLMSQPMSPIGFQPVV